ncbi:MAG: hypothetical protein MGG37_12465 [Trichodesmium sp. MAG_R01]|nr:hypothetical protein [Trichodesmium sp. MAG_R01]
MNKLPQLDYKYLVGSRKLNLGGHLKNFILIALNIEHRYKGLETLANQIPKIHSI